MPGFHLEQEMLKYFIMMLTEAVPVVASAQPHAKVATFPPPAKKKKLKQSSFTETQLNLLHVFGEHL